MTAESINAAIPVFAALIATDRLSWAEAEDALMHAYTRDPRFTGDDKKMIAAQGKIQDRLHAAVTIAEEVVAVVL